MILGIIQARMSSTRLPGKVLMPVLGEPMILRQWERVTESTHVDQWVVATSHESSDENLVDFCKQSSIQAFRGELHNVLRRFYDCAIRYQPEHIVRLTADCPLSDPNLIDDVVQQHVKHANDYTTNAFPHTFPDGLDVEVMTSECLFQANQHASSPEQYEHVTPYIRQNSQRFKIESVMASENHSSQRWTVDYPEDLALVRAVFEELYHQNPRFGWADVLSLLAARPDIFKLNQRHTQMVPE